MRVSAILAAGLSAVAIAQPVIKRESLILEIEGVLDTVSQDLNSAIDSVVDALGLSTVDDDVDSLLSALVGDVDSAVDDIDDAVDGLLDDLGLSDVVTTIDDLEEALGLSPTDTIGDLLTELGIL